MATTTVKKNELTGITSLSYIRPQNIIFKTSNMKPNTRLYAFFDGILVDSHITGTNTGSMVTDSSGNFSGTFSVPAATFNTGERVLTFTDSPSLNGTSVAGNIVGKTSAIFNATGFLHTYQQTIVNTEHIVITNENITIDNPPPTLIEPPRDIWAALGGGGGGDPLAQSFFTYGVTGGCFITKIDVWFSSKDNSLPVSLEIRDMENGYPSPKRQSETVTIPAASIVVNPTFPTTATSFIFTKPVYLAENKDYCFVLLTNSNLYHVWTSRMGDVAIETSKTIFSNPYIGTMFKSENNLTWSANQDSDIKFTIYKANFLNTNTDITAEFNAGSSPLLLEGSNIHVTAGSTLCTIRGFNVDIAPTSRIYLSGYTNGVYRGILDSELSRPDGHSITRIEPNLIEFALSGVSLPSSTGYLTNSGTVNSIFVKSGGSGYTDGTAVTISASTGIQATGIIKTNSSNAIVAVVITNPGSGYLSTPTVSVSGGTGAVLEANIDALFVVNPLRKYQVIKPKLQYTTPPDTNVTVTVATKDINTLSTGSYQHINNNVHNFLEKECILPQDGSGLLTKLTFSSTNSNVSPYIDINSKPIVELNNFIVYPKPSAPADIEAERTGFYGNAARYISKQVTLTKTSNSIKVIVNAASISSTWFDVYVRPMKSISDTGATWMLLSCDSTPNKSSVWSEYIDYEFYLDNIGEFVVFSIKILLYSESRKHFPKIANYRAIALER